MSQSQDDGTHEVPSRLIELARTGNSEAFTTLFRLHEARVRVYLLGLVGNEEDANDIAQKTFLKVWQELPRLREASRFKLWLYRIARNLAYDHWRYNKKSPYCLSLENLKEHDVVESKSDPEKQVTETDFVKQTLAELSPKFRDCLLLQVEGGFSQREIAEIVDISEGSVSTYISYARKQFRQAYRRLENELNASVRRSSEQ